MVSLDEITNYTIPEKIDFQAEEIKLRETNIKQIFNFLEIVSKYPEIVSDYQKVENEELLRKDFKAKYCTKTENEEIETDCKNFLTKFENFANDFEIKIEDLIARMMQDEYLAYKFIIDFKKQNPYESLVEDYFSFMEKDLQLTSEFKHLPVSGKDAIFVYEGIIFQDLLKAKVVETPSSVDFVWNYEFKKRKLEFYASHKYTHGSGSAQKHQMKELEAFLKHSSKTDDQNLCFIAIMDGNYYTDFPYPNLDRTPRPKIIEHIKEMYEKDNRLVATSNDLFEKILIKIKEWLEKNFSPADIKEEIAKIDILLDKCSKC